jgi:hypothetical protein
MKPVGAHRTYQLSTVKCQHVHNYYHGKRIYIGIIIVMHGKRILAGSIFIKIGVIKIILNSSKKYIDSMHEHDLTLAFIFDE